MSTPEFSRAILVERIGEPARHHLDANDTERGALATRFDLVAIKRLRAILTTLREGAGVRVVGTVEARVVQRCTVSDEPVQADIAETVDLRFTVVTAVAPDAEIELDANALDTLPLDSDTVDLGEIAAETMALALDPYPRAADADAVAARAKLMREEDVSEAARAEGPFAKLRLLQ